jgi:hypothetical protein
LCPLDLNFEKKRRKGEKEEKKGRKEEKKRREGKKERRKKTLERKREGRGTQGGSNVECDIFVEAIYAEIKFA